LEIISESIHKKRNDLHSLGVREPGVGAEDPETQKNLFVNEIVENFVFSIEDDVEFESRSTSRSLIENDESDDVEALRMKVKSLAVRPIEGGDGKQDEQLNWESELAATVDKLDQLMLLREKNQVLVRSEPQSPTIEQKTFKKKLQKLDPLPLAIVSLQTLPTSSNALPINSKFLNGSTAIDCDSKKLNKKRKLSLG
jgi:SH3-domain binding protein 5